MDPKVNYVAVGAFVLVLLIASIIFSLWLAFGYGKKAQNDYLIYMTESVAGLSQDAAVKFNGVNVGTVKEIALDPRDPSVVSIHIAIDATTPVTVDTRATLMSQGLTGLSYVNLSGGNSKSPKLKLLPGQEYPVIATSPSFLFRIDSSINQLTTSLSTISQSLQKVLNAENRQHFSHILVNLDQVTTTMADNKQQLGDSLKQLPLLLKDLTKTSQNAGQAMSDINTQTLPALNETLFMMQGMLPSLSDLTQTLATNPSSLIRGQARPVLGPGEQQP